jgi:hypothetical protein
MKGEVKRAVYKILDSWNTPRKICGGTLADMVARRIMRSVYPTVVLKTAKWWARLAGGEFDCINFEKSIYQFSPGRVKVSDTWKEILPVESMVKEYKRERGKA